ncbi:MAG: tetratricopeptide repeat protein [Chloroflexi bacterium]|nr:tetratricopeptide repeat protein [Acidobacteriota bacterium]MDA1174700.1 tetratricopeptide repeat protein [Chloroflexota bacterium]
MLLALTGRAQLVTERGERLVKRCPDLLGAYLLLSKAYEMLKRTAEARQVLEQLTERFPSAQDFADQAIASSWLAEGQLESALDYLKHRADEGSLGAGSILLQARLLVQAQRQDLALDSLELLIFSAGRDHLSRSDMIGARLLFGMLSALASKTDQARSAARALTELFPNHQEAIVGAIQIYTAIGDERQLRSMSRSYGDDAPDRVRFALLENLAKL